MRRPRVAHVVASRGQKLEVTIRGSGTPAASTLARHCEATGVSLPRIAWELSSVSHTDARRDANVHTMEKLKWRYDWRPKLRAISRFER